MNWKKQKIKWIDDFIKESKLEDDDEIDMELLVEWLAKKHCNKAENLPISDDRLSLLNKVKEIAFGDGSAQERMVDIKALLSNEA